MNGDGKAKIHNTPKIEISVRNFGPIAEADLDLRPLTVFVGPSNTGKTYLSVLIYALHRMFEGFSRFPLTDYVISPSPSHLSQSSLSNANAVVEQIQNLQEKLYRKRGVFRFSDLPEEIRNSVAQRILNYSNYFSGELERCFDLDSVSELIRSPSSQNDKTTVSLIASEENWDLWSVKIGVSQSEVTTDGDINEKMILPPQGVETLKNIRFHEDLLPGSFSWIREQPQRPHYLPAARSGILQSHRVIASSLVARSTRSGLDMSETPTLSGGVADFMQKLILYREGAKSDDRIDSLADALESDVLDGQIIMQPSPTGYPEFLYRPRGTEQDIRLTRSSSMVSELAPLVLFIRGLVRPGDTLIIEEPEAHLHPAAQTQMAATLARLVRAGVRVIVTTHSDFMLKEIANLMHEGELEEKGALKKQAGKPERWLLPEEVGVWLFQKNGIVDEIKFDRIHGIEPIEYEDVAEALYNRWAGLQNRIEELKDEHELECE